MDAMGWHIAGRPREVDFGSFDGIEWLWPLVSDADERANVSVGVSGTALASKTVPRATAHAISTNGRSAIEAILTWSRPPDRIIFTTSDWPNVYGGEPPPLSPAERAELADIRNWFAARGYDLNLHRVEGAWSAALMKRDRRVGSGSFTFGSSALDAARRTKREHEPEDDAA
jgi:hypothetical protein